jgi:signal transduction histidine kinase
MGQLTDTLNNMLGRLENTYNVLDDAYKAQRRFVSDASHELRTPLTTIRGNIELLERMWLPALETAEAAGESGEHAELDRADGDLQRVMLTREAMQDIAGEAKRMSSLVNDLLSLARADAGYAMEKTVQPLLPIVEDVARRAQLLPRTAEWRIGDLQSLEGVEVLAHADFLRQLFFIFVENAFKYTPSGYVELRAMRSADQAGVVIKDTGIGMNSAEIPHIFERFYRADESRGQTSGTGLGLSIAKWIIDEHGGSVEVSTREGEGSTFIVWLPVAFIDNSNRV